MFRPGESLAVSDWSGDRQLALLTSTTSTGPGLVTEYDLVTGTVLASFVEHQVQQISFSKPDGTALLVDAARGSNLSDSLTRDSLAGAVEVTFPSNLPGVGKYADSAVYTPDGTELVVGATDGLALLSNSGGFLRALPVSHVTGGCAIAGWWAAGVAIAGCVTTHPQWSQSYFLVPTSGATPSRLASVPLSTNFSVWHAPSGTYTVDGACSTIWTVKLDPAGNWERFAIAGVQPSESNWIIGTYGDLLEVQVTPNCTVGAGHASAPPSVLWYDPAAGSSKVILGTGANGGYVLWALAFGEDPSA